MDQVTYDNIPIGYLPLHCFQCQEGRAHEIFKVQVRAKRLFGKTKLADYGLTSRCPDCGLCASVGEECSSAVSEAPPALIHEAANEAFGEENAVEQWSRVLEDIRVGLAQPNERFQAMGAVYEAISNHFAQPVLQAPLERTESSKRHFWVWMVGAAVIVGLCFGFTSSQANPIPAGIITSVGSLIGWSVLLSVLTRKEQRPNHFTSKTKSEIVSRLASGLAPIRPTGAEIEQIRQIGLGQQMWAAIPETHQVLVGVQSVTPAVRGAA